MAGKTQAQADSWLTPLANQLLARHINVSVPDYSLRRDLLAKDEPLLWNQSQRKLRCIAVVGAGASAPVLARGDDLASNLIQKFNIGDAAIKAEHERLARITAVDPEEFEAKLSAIGQTLGSTRPVRAAISDLYRMRHPTVLAYELLAHLLKHRFVDAIINMNFDELLDQSLDDELGIGEYERIVSDRDCVHAQSNVFAPDYIPLHIKLHGTASEPESLRFTRESYYDSPVQVGTETARLFQVPECVVLNIGFGMASFDLHRLLAIPDRLWLYNLSHDPLTEKARSAIEGERERHGKEDPSFEESPENEEKRKAWLKQQEKRSRKGKPKRNERQVAPLPSARAFDASDRAMGALLKCITHEVEGLTGRSASAVALRPVMRHRTVVSLLGSKSNPGRRLIELPHHFEDPRLSLDPISRAARPNAVAAGYLLRRTILELAMAMARGRGLVSIATLAVDRGGLYYDAYCRYAGTKLVSWESLFALVGFEQDPGVPDVVVACPEIRLNPNRVSTERKLRKRLLAPPRNGEKDVWHELPELDIPKLAHRVHPHIVDSPSKGNLRRLIRELGQLCESTEYEVHSRDDRVCAKTFSHPVTLKTLSGFNAQSYDLAKDADNPDKYTEVDIISETGDWLIQRDDKFVEHLGGADRIRLIVAFLCDVPDVRERFPKIELKYQQPWHHNRHMAIVRSDGLPLQAIYFARHHRTPYVNPVHLTRRRDIHVLETAFEERWANATKVRKEKKKKKR
jgi:hypothetical protein